MTSPAAAAPAPIPVKITPLTSPLLLGGTCGSTAGAASTINTPPDIPEMTRQAKNQRNGSCIAQAKNAADAAIIIARSEKTAPVRAAAGRASNTPTRYPARLAAPRSTACDG